MEWSALVLLLVLLPPPCASDDRLLVGKPLSPGTTIVSDDGGFALGFFSPANSSSTPANLYLGIWYADIPTLTPVWVANRGASATNTTSSSVTIPTLSLTNTSNLVLSDATGHVFWTTNVTVSGEVTGGNISGSYAVLLNSGNLAIRSANGTALWQSFEHPTDTFLPGMKIRVVYSTRAAERLISWTSPDDPSPGRFSYGVDTFTSLQLFLWNGTVPIMRDGPWTGYSVASRYQPNASAFVYQAIVSTDEEIYLTYTLSDGAPRARYIVTDSGEYQFQSWNATLSSWAVLGVWPASDCNRYGHCGAFGYCDNTAAAPSPETCRCLEGFEPADADEWNHGVFSAGCRRKEAVRCTDGYFAPLTGMKSPDKFVHVANRTQEECRVECANNCSCVAYAYANLSTTRTTGDVTRCLVWAGELIDTEKMGDIVGSDTLYLRLAGMNNAPVQGVSVNGKSNALRIALPTVLASTALIITGIFLAWFKFKGTGSEFVLL
nr:unnamed protein product [Digitaria exilis]